MPKQKGKGGKKSGKATRSTSNSPNKGAGHQETKKNETTALPEDPVLKLKELGNREFEKANFDVAIKHYTQALKIGSENSHTIYSNRAVAYLHTNQIDLAIQDADMCIKIKPDWPKGYIRKSTCFLEQGNYEEAESILQVGLEKCSEKNVLSQAMNELDSKKISTLSRDEKIVGGLNHPHSQKFRKLINWLIQGGAKFPKLYLKFYSVEYRAIHAMDRISKDEVICHIPHDYIMTSDVAKASKIGKAILNSKVELRSKHSYLASYLLQEKEKGEESQWKVYIDILPRKFETIPLFFTEQQRRELTGSISLKKIDDRLESLRAEYDNICEHVPEFARFSHEDFVWARLVVITRIFGLVIDGIKTDGLVPMADMLNHKRPRETKWTYEQERRGFEITALQNIKKDSEIYDSYGRKCNSRFFVNYGFSLENNDDNEALLIFELPHTDSQWQLKLRYLQMHDQNTSNNNVSNNSHMPNYNNHFQNNNNIHNNNNNNNENHNENTDPNYYREFQIPRHYKEKKVKEAFSFLRILNAQGKDFFVISGSSDNNAIDNIPPLSIQNEEKVLTTLAVAASKTLKAFEHSLEHDNELLKDEENYPKYGNARNIVLMRRGEKEVLHFYINLLKVVKPLFKMRMKELRVKLRKEFKDNEDPYTQYVTQVVAQLVNKSNG